jgi:hypothetical protein
MNIKVKKEKFDTYSSCQTGGEYVDTKHEVHIDTNLPFSMQVENGVHAGLEIYFSCMPHDQIVECTNVIMEIVGELLND